MTISCLRRFVHIYYGGDSTSDSGLLSDDRPGGAIAVTSRQKAVFCAKAAHEKKAEQIRVLDVSRLTPLADYFVICSGESSRQVLAAAEAIDKELQQVGSAPMSVEGRENGQWILMDYADVIVHLFRSDIREFYGLDQLWGDAPRVRVSLAPRSRRPSAEGAAAPRRRSRSSSGKS